MVKESWIVGTTYMGEIIIELDAHSVTPAECAQLLQDWPGSCYLHYEAGHLSGTLHQ